jgi:hypothetical protein
LRNKGEKFSGKTGCHVRERSVVMQNLQRIGRNKTGSNSCPARSRREWGIDEKV